MSEETKDLIIIPAFDAEVLASKEKSWASVGVCLFKEEETIKLLALQISAKIKTPSKIEEVKDATITLAQVKKERTELSERRKLSTRKLDGVVARMSIPEKSFDEAIAKSEAAIISLTKADTERQKKDAEKIAKTTACREFLVKAKNEADADFKKAILEKLEKVYLHALGKGEIDMKKLPAFITLAKSRMTEADFKIQYPLNTFSEFVPNEGYVKLCNEILIIDSKIYLKQYHDDIDFKFADYEVALNNKGKALAIAKQETGAKAQQIIDTKANADTAAILNSMTAQTFTGVISHTTKPLKSSYAIDMEETAESAIFIMGAFAQYIHLCKPYLNVNKWFSFTVSQAGIALAKVKTKDEGFAPAGIKFKTVDKL